jgi:hypothetical protein
VDNWVIIFMLVVLKLPVIYLCGVVWWAIKAEPRPPEGADATVPDDDPGPWLWWRRSRRRRPRGGPHSVPSRRAPRTPRPTAARAQRR